MLGYRNSYRRTVAAALLASSLAVMAAIGLLVTPSAVFPLRLAAELLSLVCLAIAVLAGLVAAGGIIGLHRDMMEQRGQPYYSGQPRERSAGTLVRLRRRLLTLLPGSLARLRLWPGEWVKVRSLAEISATLDGEGRLDGLPFMLEMLRHCGQRHRVFRRIEKIHYYFGPVAPHLRRLRDAVLLEELRCDGTGHGGCQAGCQFIWKEAWLVPSDSAHNADIVTQEAASASWLGKYTQMSSPDGEVRYACQMTELPGATTRLSWNDPRNYWRDLCSGNVRLNPLITAVALALFNVVQRKSGGAVAPYREPTDRKTSPLEVLDLQPGEIVRVKTKSEIEQTLNSGSKNRGLWFDREMHRFCGGEFRVATVVRKIVDEASGKMLTMNNPCIILEGVAATGEYLGLCPQNELIYWREAWLERVGLRAEMSSRAMDSSNAEVHPSSNLPT
jgi:hypothetical protein